MMELDAHKTAVARAYGLASDGYNKPALIFFSQGAESLVDFAGLSPGQRILDVASGTGHAAFYAGRKVGVRGSVVGIDIAEQMVNLANTHARALSASNVRFELMDGEHASFDDNEFDAVLCSYGVFFIPEMVNGVKEWKRVTKHGGWVCLSAFGETAFQPQSDLFENRIRQFGPIIPDRKRPFGWQRLVELWNSGFRAPLAQLNAADLRQFREDHLREVGALGRGDGIFFDATTFLARGQVQK
jgi:arsenite methyltransferase